MKGSYKCECVSPYVGDGYTCEKITDQCQEASICDSNADCLPQKGFKTSYSQIVR